MTPILIIATIAFIGSLCTYQLGKWAERNMWIKWADSDPDLWPNHLADVDRRKLSDTPTPKARRIQMFNSGFENGELAATRRLAILADAKASHPGRIGKPKADDQPPGAISDQIEVAEQAAS